MSRRVLPAVALLLFASCGGGLEGDWTNPEGEKAPSEMVKSSEGPDHCGWQSATLLHLWVAAWDYQHDEFGLSPVLA